MVAMEEHSSWERKPAYFFIALKATEALCRLWNSDKLMGSMSKPITVVVPKGRILPHYETWSLNAHPQESQNRTAGLELWECHKQNPGQETRASLFSGPRSAPISLPFLEHSSATHLAPIFSTFLESVTHFLVTITATLVCSCACSVWQHT